MHPSLSRSSRPGLRARATFVAAVVACSALSGVTLTAQQATGASGGKADLEVSPTTYVGGQDLRWTGNVGHRGVRSIELQYNMGRVWNTVEGFHDQTARNGSFAFHFPAPSMMNIRYRVKAGRYTTPGRVFVAKTPDLTIRKAGQPANNTNAPAKVDPGQAFGITVDTTPDNIMRSPGSRGLPVFEGRDLALQKRRANGTWRTVARSRVDADGLGSFKGLTEGAGVSVYRVKEGDWFEGRNQVGWVPSFPLYVLAGANAQQWYADHYGDNEPARSLSPGGGLGAQPPTASQRYEWFAALYDFAWEYGQSLSSPPARGTRIKGHWTEYSDGAGRVAKYNGGLAIDSKRFTGAGDGDFGTTIATLKGNAITQGRWETSLRIRNAFEDTGHPYQVAAELVPAKAADYDCGAHNITIADITPFSRTMHFGVRSRDHAWSGRTKAPETPRSSVYNVAVEVAGDHLTWFLDSKPVGSVTADEAVPGVPLALRLVMRGDGDREMDQTGLISDWQRGFPIDHGRETVSSKLLDRKPAPKADCSAP